MNDKLIAIGFSEYEAKAYLALLLKNPATAYEIAKNSAIPTSKIYEVLNKLMDRGAALKIEHAHKQKFIPLSPEELIAQHRSRIEDTLSSLQEGLHHFQHDRQVSYIWNILDYDTLMEKARHLLKKANQHVLMSLWREEVEHLDGEMRTAVNRGVKLAVVHFGHHTVIPGQLYPHPIEDTLYAEKGGRGLVITVDSREVLFGKIAAGTMVEPSYRR